MGSSSFCIETGGGSSQALSPAQTLRKRKTAVGFWPFKTDLIAHCFVLLTFSNTRLSGFFLTLGHLYARTDADSDPTQPFRISLEMMSKDNLG